MNIPDEAVETVAKILFSRDAASSGILRTWDQIPEASRRYYIADAHIGLEAAAPFIAAQALADEADYLDSALNAVLDGDPEDLSASGIIQRLRNRADGLDPQ